MKLLQKIGAALAVATLVLGSCEQGAGVARIEEGTAITIGSAESLAKIGVDADFPLNGSYRLTADLTLNNWTPLGDFEQEFSGVFDGAGRTITFAGSGGRGTGGLFAFIKDAAIRRLTVAGTITAESTEGEPIQVGGVAGNAVASVIENCTSSVDITATGRGHNSAAGGIVGFMRQNTTIRACAATGDIVLKAEGQDGAGDGLMLYAGGIAGYSGTGTAGEGVSGCEIIGTSWQGGTVSAEGAYPYAGGIAGYNYTGAAIRQCFTTGTVRANGKNLPYSGGVAGYNSGYVQQTLQAGGDAQPIVSLIENCYSTAEVIAKSDSKAALSGGIAGANARGAVISKCYATGLVTAKVNGSSTAGNGGTLGVPAAANAGGIAGAQYYTHPGGPAPRIEFCAALNPSLTGEDTATGASWNIHRIAGKGDTVYNSVLGTTSSFDTGKWLNNIANEDMFITLTPPPPPLIPASTTKTARTARHSRCNLSTKTRWAGISTASGKWAEDTRCFEFRAGSSEYAVWLDCRAMVRLLHRS
ncbi:MAG: hypothetical protein LBD20_07760 [Spirochaetaceae bacterium]|jgi:hypothetical protein|nr:hypothetical protein [Spirochaetaceae bacterium]